MSFLLHFGDHETTTAVHFASVAAAAGWDILPMPSRQHVVLPHEGVKGYFWIESGIASYPLNPHRVEYPTCGYLIDVHLNQAASLLRARLFDVVFIAQRNYLDEFRTVNPSTYWLPLAAPEDFVVAQREPEFDVGFVGNVRPGTRRERLLEAIETKFSMNDWRRNYSIAEMRDIYCRSRVVVNDPILGDLNMRFFEAMACGAAVVNPQISNGLDEVAERNTHFAVADFESPLAVSRVVEELLNTGRWQSLGEAGRALVAARHTYTNRFAEVAAHLNAAGLTAPIRRMPRKAVARTFAKLGDLQGDPRLALAGLRESWIVDPLSVGLAARGWLKNQKRRRSAGPGRARRAKRR